MFSNKSKKRVYIHIGFEKTGSTAIQDYCAANSDALARKGIFYPADKSAPLVYDRTHWPIVAVFSETNKFVPPQKQLTVTELKKSIDEVIQSSKCENIVFSAEPFSSMLLDNEVLSRLKDVFQGYEVKIVAYIRRQDSFFISHISNYVKGGRFLKLSDKITLENAEVHYQNADRYDFDRILGRWATVFGEDNLIVRAFESPSLLNNDVVADFLDILGIDYRQMPESNRSNESLKIEPLLFLNMLNVGASTALLEGYRAKVINALTRYPTKRLEQALISNTFRMEIVRMYEASNKKVARRYFKGRDVLFTAELPDESVEWKPVTPLTHFELLHLVKYLHACLPDSSPRIIQSLCRSRVKKSPLYAWAQRMLLPVYGEVVIAPPNDE